MLLLLLFYYLVKVEQRLEEEKHRAEAYLDISTGVKLARALEEELISKYAPRLVKVSNQVFFYFLFSIFCFIYLFYLFFCVF